MRLLTTIYCALLLVQFNFAQSGTVITYEVTLRSWSGTCEAKPLIAAVAQRFPEAELVLSTDCSSLRITTTRVIEVQDLERAVSQAAFDVVSFLPTVPEGDGLIIDPELRTFPVFIDTGDPGGDAAAYTAAKSAWILAHPERYERMKSGSLDHTPVKDLR